MILRASIIRLLNSDTILNLSNLERHENKNISIETIKLRVKEVQESFNSFSKISRARLDKQ